MVGDDACTAFIEILKKLLEMAEKLHKPRDKSVKIKVGELSKKDFAKLIKDGKEFKYISVPADKLPEIEKTIKKMHGSYFNTELGDSKTAVIAVPTNQLDMINAALKYVVEKELKESPSSVKIKDGADLIGKDDIKIVSDVLNERDIPVITFQTSDDKYMNVVSAEYEGQYAEAMREAAELKKELDNIEVVRYDQTSPLDAPEYEAVLMTDDEARELAAAAKESGLDMSFARYGDKTAALYKSELSDKVNEAREDYRNSLEESEDYLIEVMDNTITLDIGKLENNELSDNDSYFMKIPNTSGQDYMRISRNEAGMLNNGNTLKTELDMDRIYPIYNRSGQIKDEKRGSDLAQYFNTRNRHADKDTKVYSFGNRQGLDRIDLYNSKKNELISIKTDSAENVKIALAERGISSKTADKLLADINEKLSGQQKEAFGYTAEKTAVVYADIPNIGEYLAQSQLSQTVIGKAECKGELPRDSGAKCCVMDKNTNSFTVLPVLPIKEVQARLSQMGYSEMSAKEIADKVVKNYRETDVILDKPKETRISAADIKDFDSVNAQLRNMGYVRSGDSTIVIRDDDSTYKYMQIDRSSTLSDVERALADDFNLDSISVAIAVKSLMRENAIRDAVIDVKEHGNAEISNLTSKAVEIRNKENDKSDILPKENISVEKLTAIGISEKTAGEIKKSFEKNLKEAKHPEKQTLGELIRYAAAEKAKEVGQAVKEKAVSIGKGQER